MDKPVGKRIRCGESQLTDFGHVRADEGVHSVQFGALGPLRQSGELVVDVTHQPANT
jgi:hypothetical protein